MRYRTGRNSVEVLYVSKVGRERKLKFLKLQGIRYIHATEVVFHGCLTSACCLLDKYFTLKITDLAYDRLRIILADKSSPDLTEKNNPGGERNLFLKKKKDILSMGIILLELCTQTVWTARNAEVVTGTLLS